MSDQVKRFPLRLDSETRAKLDELSKATGRPRAHIIRDLIELARPTNKPVLELAEAGRG